VTQLLPFNFDTIREAADILRRGGLVAFPTETVYGLGSAAENPAAVRAMFAAKGRPTDHPVILHVAEAALLPKYAADVPPEAWKLAEAFWPGPMTLILCRSAGVNDLVTGGLETVGLRVPAHPVSQALLKAFAGPIAAPSANRFGRVSATRAEHVRQELEGHVDLILDGGDCPVGLESTIIDLSRGHAAILRPGAVTAEQVSQLLRHPVSVSEKGGPRVSGALPSHYAPRAIVEIVSPENLAGRASELAATGKKVAVLASNHLSSFEELAEQVVVLSLPGREQDAARELYALLRHVDELGCDVALTVLPAEQGLGVAIADRLRRAAGPR
jgi:L-threonylcarbamoyladenylate synthase